MSLSSPLPAVSWTIHRLGKGDGARLREIRLRALQDSPDAFGSTYAQCTDRPLSAWEKQVEGLPTFLATKEGCDVGMVRFAVDEQDGNVAWLISMWVAPEVRGLGLGSSLIDRLIDYAKLMRVQRIRLDVADGNASAIALYERKGFLPTGVTGAMPVPRQHITEHQRELILSKE